MVGREKKRNSYICTQTQRQQLQGAIFRDGRERKGKKYRDGQIDTQNERKIDIQIERVSESRQTDRQIEREGERERERLCCDAFAADLFLLLMLLPLPLLCCASQTHSAASRNLRFRSREISSFSDSSSICFPPEPHLRICQSNDKRSSPRPLSIYRDIPANKASLHFSDSSSSCFPPKASLLTSPQLTKYLQAQQPWQPLLLQQLLPKRSL